MGIEVSRDGKRVYETEGNENKSSAIDVGTLKVVHTFQFGHKEPHGLVLVPGTNQMLVTNRGSANISVIDLITNKELATIAVAPRPDIIAISPDGKERACRSLTFRDERSWPLLSSAVTHHEFNGNRLFHVLYTHGTCP